MTKKLIGVLVIITFILSFNYAYGAVDDDFQNVFRSDFEQAEVNGTENNFPSGWIKASNDSAIPSVDNFVRIAPDGETGNHYMRIFRSHNVGSKTIGVRKDLSGTDIITKPVVIEFDYLEISRTESKPPQTQFVFLNTAGSGQVAKIDFTTEFKVYTTGGVVYNYGTPIAIEVGTRYRVKLIFDNTTKMHKVFLNGKQIGPEEGIPFQSTLTTVNPNFLDIKAPANTSAYVNVAIDNLRIYKTQLLSAWNVNGEVPGANPILKSGDKIGISFTSPIDISTINKDSFKLAKIDGDAETAVDYFTVDDITANGCNVLLTPEAPQSMQHKLIATYHLGIEGYSLMENEFAFETWGDSAGIVSITNPKDGESFLPSEQIEIISNVTDLDGIKKVDFYNDGVFVGQCVADEGATSTTGIYKYNWDNPGLGIYDLSVKITDNNDIVTTSEINQIKVDNFIVELPVFTKNNLSFDEYQIGDTIKAEVTVKNETGTSKHGLIILALYENDTLKGVSINNMDVTGTSASQFTTLTIPQGVVVGNCYLSAFVWDRDEELKPWCKVSSK